MKKISIRYGNIILNPLSRNLLRITCLLAGYKVEFLQNSESFTLSHEIKAIKFPINNINGDYIFKDEGLLGIKNIDDFNNLIGEKEEYKFDILSYVSKYSQGITEKYLWILFKIVLYRFDGNRNFENIDFKEFCDIIMDIYSYSNEYSKENFKFNSKTIEKLWENNYEGIGKFQINTKGEINTVNSSETKEYKRLFDVAKTGVESIDNAIQTLLDILPEDAEKILDIGSGPGYVNRNIPPYYNVLAMDLDEEILKENTRQWCIGDVLDIPLVDKSVDMTMICDVLEHIEQDSLQKAISELERVSSKYMYIQVPFNEYLGESIALCGSCGNKWHVNYHKNSFGYEKIAKLVSRDWNVHTVAFTGAVLSYDGYKDGGQILDSMNIEYHEVENWKCPVCGGETIKTNDSYMNIANEIAKTYFENDRVPVYSEIAILFERKNSINKIEKSKQNNDKFKTLKLNTADIILNKSSKLMMMKDYIKNSKLPYYVTIDFNVSFDDYGMNLNKNVNGNGAILFFLPISFSGAEKTVFFKVKSNKDVNFIICSIDLNGNEYKISEQKTMGNVFDFRVALDSSIRSTFGVFKIYADNDFSLCQISVEKDSGLDYTRYIATESEKNLCKEINGINLMWFVGDKGFVDLADEISIWLNQSSYYKFDNKYIFDYVELIYKRLFKLSDKALEKENEILNFKESIQDLEEKNQSLELSAQELKLKNQSLLKEIEYLSSEELKNAINMVQMEVYEEYLLQNERLKEELDSKCYQVSVLSEKLALYSEKTDEMERNIYMYKSNLALCDSNIRVRNFGIKTLALKVVRKTIRVTKKCVIKVPFLYSFLVRIGAKKVYNIIKTKIKGDNKYE